MWIQVRVVPERKLQLSGQTSESSSSFPKAPLGPGEATSQVQAVLSSLMDDPSLYLKHSKQVNNNPQVD